MGLFHAYRPVTQRLGESRMVGSRRYDDVIHHDIAVQEIFYELCSRRIRSPQIKTPEGIISFGVKPLSGSYFLEVNFDNIQNLGQFFNGMARLSVTKMLGNDPEFYISRDFEANGREIGYDVGLLCSGPDNVVLSMRLPSSLTKTDKVVGSFAYKRLSRNKRQTLMKEDIEPIIQDSMGRGCGFFKVAKRVDGKCITQFCPEPRKVNKKELVRIFERTFGMSGKSEIIYEDTSGYRGDNHQEVMLSSSPVKFILLDEHGDISRSEFNDMFRILGLTPPLYSELSYGERYTTITGESTRKYVNRALESVKSSAKSLKGKIQPTQIGKGLATVGRAIAYPFTSVKDKVREIKYERSRRQDEENRRVSSWLGKYATPNMTRFDGVVDPKTHAQGCIIFVDPVCEMQVRKGKKPQEETTTEIRE